MSKIINTATSPIFREVEDIDPLKLVGNARLALHHHMAPAGALDEHNQEAQTHCNESREVNEKIATVSVGVIP